MTAVKKKKTSGPFLHLRDLTGLYMEMRIYVPFCEWRVTIVTSAVKKNTVLASQSRQWWKIYDDEKKA